jgi:hypothetical protein
MSTFENSRPGSFVLHGVAAAIFASAAVGLTAEQLPQSASSATAAAGSSWVQPRTPWGDPDLQGIWTTDDEVRVPVERPKELGTRAVLSEEEMAERLREVERRARDDKKERRQLAEDQTGDGPEHWYEQGRAISRRTSLIIDPPDGRLPPLTAEGKKRLDDSRTRGSFANRLWEGPEALDLRDRCITRGVPNTWFPSAYNNGFQIVQSPGYVAILHERLHEARIVPVNGRAHLNQGVRQWIGDPRGRWDGDTLVVETTNFSEKAEFRGAAGNLRIVERFKRVDADTVTVEFTVEDSTTWTKPWTALLTGKRDANYWQIFEYACHEGNYGMFNILSGARAQERAMEAARKGTTKGTTGK